MRFFPWRRSGAKDGAGRRTRSRLWPTATPPTVPFAQPPAFHCPQCRHPAPDGRADCPSCGAHLLGEFG